MSPVLGLFLPPPLPLVTKRHQIPPPRPMTSPIHLDLKNIKIAEKPYSFNLET